MMASGGRLAHVVGARLEGEPPHRDHLAREPAEVRGDARQQDARLLLVRAVHRLHDAERGPASLAIFSSAFTSFGKQDPP